MPDTTDSKNLENLETAIGYTFKNQNLLVRAITRLAYAKERGLPDEAHLDALATLGDAVIDVVVISSLLRDGEYDKGIISNKKMNLVNMSELRHLAESISLWEYVRWGRGEKIQHVWTSGRVLAECIEAVCGAVYLDSGVDGVEVVLRTLGLIKKA